MYMIYIYIIDIHTLTHSIENMLLGTDLAPESDRKHQLSSPPHTRATCANPQRTNAGGDHYPLVMTNIDIAIENGYL